MCIVVPTPSSRIGILGGSFNPVHNGHLAVARMAYEYFSLTTVYFIPAYIPPHKQKSVTVSAHHRITMLTRAIANSASFSVWEGEITRGGISFTVDTLHILKEMHPEASLYFIIGSDNLSDLLTWHQYKKIISLVTLCVAHRPGYTMRVPPELSHARVVPFSSPEWGISSSKIRAYLAQGLSCRYLLPEKVEKYIKKNRLYRN